MRRFLKGHRTRIFGTLVAVLGLVETYDDQIVRQLVPENYQGLMMLAIGAGVIILRQITTTPPGAKY
jgi:hypothetical protein